MKRRENRNKELLNIFSG